jgi:uncharacterized membrane protein YvlD (DUF360 family)
MIKTFWLILVNTLTLYLSTLIIPNGIQSDSLMTTFLASFIVAGCTYITFQTIIGKLISSVVLGISFVLGGIGVLFTLFAMESLFLYTASWALDGFVITGFWWAMLVSVFLTIGAQLLVSNPK